ncbi:MAG TPA: hypothetical protein VFS08_04270 [Gemmatimonadaceae bacterium]|nr:hypothetical protein [Gemmatimonadaceae bacterium]
MSNQGDRWRQIAYHDLERVEDEQALQGRATDRDGQREPAAASRNGIAERAQRPPRDRTTHLTERERRERWPIG